MTSGPHSEKWPVDEYGNPADPQPGGLTQTGEGWSGSGPHEHAEYHAEIRMVAEQIIEEDTGYGTWENSFASALLAALAELEQAREAGDRVASAWKRLGECEDEFGTCSEFCAEWASALDDAITALAGSAASNKETDA